MPHEILSNDSLVLAGRPAWHGLGVVVQDAPSPHEALRIAGLDWEVCLTDDVASLTDNDVILKSTRHRMVYRKDDFSVLSVVTDGWTPFQNKDLAELASRMAVTGSAEIESAGSLHGGRRVWFLLRTPSIDVGGQGDEVCPYFLLANGHDGTMSLTGLPTYVRVVCNNTLTSALAPASRDIAARTFRFRHTRGLLDRIDEMRDMMTGFSQVVRIDREAMDALAHRMPTREEVQSLWTDVIVRLDGPIPPAAPNASERDLRRRDRAIEALSHMTRVFEEEASLYGHSLFVAVNAATNWIDHVRGRLSGDARLASRTWGAYADAKRVAFDAALALA